MKDRELADMIDHTCLKPNGTPEDIKRLCREAKKYHFASVCVFPADVEDCVKFLGKSDVHICTVIGFPFGQSTPETICFEAVDALESGADELDFVLNVREFKAALRKKSGWYDLTDRWHDVIAEIAHEYPSAITKLILECCYLTDEEKVSAAVLAEKARFDFVKTSTGFGPGGATVHDVELLYETIPETMGVKAAGGIRTRADAEAMIEAGATRLGCSAGVAIVTGTVDTNSK